MAHAQAVAAVPGPYPRVENFLYKNNLNDNSSKFYTNTKKKG